MSAKPSSPTMCADAQFMAQALVCAQAAAAAGEVPVGAVLVHQGRIIAKGRNAPISQCDPSAHAEIQALRTAARKLGNYRLEDCTLYVTLEPCAMCSGAILHARLQRVVIGAADPRTGSAGSVVNLFADSRLNHHTQLTHGVMASACSALLRDFFSHRRQAHREQAAPLPATALRTPPEYFGAMEEGLYTRTLPALDGLRMHYADIQRTSTHGGTADQRACWVLLHGELAHGAVFRDGVQELTLSGARVLVPDLPGFGRSDKPKKPTVHTLQWHAQVLQEWFAQCHVTEPIHLLAHGAAAPLALMWWQAASSQCKELVLIAPWFCLPAPHPLAVNAAMLSWYMTFTRSRRIPDVRWMAKADDAAHHALGPRDIQMLQAPFPDAGHCAALRAFAPCGDIHVVQNLYTALHSTRPRREKCRVHVITGENDALCPPARAQSIADWLHTLGLHVQCHTVAQAGHWLPLQTRHLFATIHSRPR